MNLKVMGLRVEKYIRSTCEGHNCDFEYGQVVDDKHTILCESKWKEKYEIELTYEERDVISVVEQIRNLVSYILVNEKTGEKIQLQNIKVFIDIAGYGRFLKDRLEELGIQCEYITSGAWLKRFCRRQDVAYVDDYDYMFKKENK